MTGSASAFRAARDLLLQHRDNYDRAYAEFCWPELDGFNWALDWFDAIGGDAIAVWVVDEDGSEQKRSFAELSERSNRVANHLRRLGVARGDRLILMLGNQLELWETLLAAMKLGAVVIPATTLLGPIDLADRVERGGARHVVTGASDADKFAAVPGDYTQIAVGGAARRLAPVRGCLRRRKLVRAGREDVGGGSAPSLLHLRNYRAAEARRAHAFVVPGWASVHDVLAGVQPGDVHLNIDPSSSMTHSAISSPPIAS